MNILLLWRKKFLDFLRKTFASLEWAGVELNGRHYEPEKTTDTNTDIAEEDDNERFE